MQELINERDNEDEINKVLNQISQKIPNLNTNEYIFQLIYKRDTKELTTMIAIPPDVLAKGLAMTLAENTDEDHLRIFLDNILNEFQQIKKREK